MLETIIAAVAGLVGVGIGAWATLHGRKATEAKVEFVDISVVAPGELQELVEGGEGQAVESLRSYLQQDRLLARSRDGTITDQFLVTFPVILDIKLRNSGGQAAYVHEFGAHMFRVLRHELRVPQPTAYQHPSGRELASVAASAFYPAELEIFPGQTSAAPISQRMSQVIPPGGTDRFVVFFPVGPHIDFFHLDAEVTYNASRTAASGKTVVSPLLGHPIILRGDDLLQQLRQALTEGRRHYWEMSSLGMEVPSPLESMRAWFEEYERDLKYVASIYETTGNDACEQYARIQEARTEIPRMRNELGVDAGQ